MFIDINIKPAFWVGKLISNRLLTIMRKLNESQLKINIKKIIDYYKNTIFTHKRFRKIKRWLYVQIIQPLNYMIERVLLKMDHSIWLFDWTYKFNY